MIMTTRMKPKIMALSPILTESSPKEAPTVCWLEIVTDIGSDAVLRMMARFSASSSVKPEIWTFVERASRIVAVLFTWPSMTMDRGCPM